MSIIDTSILIDKVSEGKIVSDNITVITLIEYPMILEYKNFSGKVFYPDEKDFNLSPELQQGLRKEGRMKGASDLIAAICINNNEKLLTSDRDFDDLSKISKLKLL